MVLALIEGDKDIKLNSFNLLKNELATSTSSMSSIPKPLKFLRLHFEKIKSLYDQLDQFDTFKLQISDLLAVLVIVTPNIKENCLYFVLNGTKTDLNSWGQEFIRTLSGEIGTDYLKRLENEEPIEDLIELVKQIAPYLIQIHSENEAIDLLLEVERLEYLIQFCNTVNFKRVCLYLLTNSYYSADTDEYKQVLKTAYDIYIKFESFTNALRVAIKLLDFELMHQAFSLCKDETMKKQLAFILARQRIYLEGLSPELTTIMSNLKTSDYFKKLARELDVIEPKAPEDIFKSHLEDKKASENIDSYKLNLASSIVSSFINAGFGKEKLLIKPGSDWIGKNKEEGLICTIAGLGLVNLW